MSSDVGAEKLLSKGFELLPNVFKIENNKYFALTNGNRQIGLDFQKEDDYSYIKVCYWKTFQTDYETLKASVMKSGNKVSFFFGKDYIVYFTEYYFNGLYFYFGKGICMDDVDMYKNNMFFCSNK